MSATCSALALVPMAAKAFAIHKIKGILGDAMGHNNDARKGEHAV